MALSFSGPEIGASWGPEEPVEWLSLRYLSIARMGNGQTRDTVFSAAEGKMTETRSTKPGRTIRLIVHGKAAGRPDLRAAVGALRSEGHHIEVRVTWEGGDSLRLAREAVQEEVSTIVAGGGDGSINEVASGMISAADRASSLPSFGVLPLGTANDFARSGGISLDLLEALRVSVEVPARPVDVGRIGERIFVNVATGGFGTKITLETPEETKKILGGAAYFLTGVKQFGSVRASRARFTGPDFEWEGPFLVMALGNGKQAGGGHVLCPEGVIDDGRLELSVLPDVPQGEVAQALGALLKEGIAAIKRDVITAHLEWVRIEADETLYINLDGEPISGEEFEFRVEPDALMMHLPESSPLLGRGE